MLTYVVLIFLCINAQEDTHIIGDLKVENMPKCENISLKDCFIIKLFLVIVIL
jgi:hypothetical protein